MPLIVNAPQFSLYESNLTATPAGASFGTAVSHPAGGPHVKNTSWTQLIASTAFDAQLVIVTVGANSVSNGDSSTLLDIGIGASSSESVVIPDIPAGFASDPSTQGARSTPFPLYIPSGSRLSARTQSIRVTGSVRVLVQLLGGPRYPDAVWCGQQVTAYGADAATSAGTKFTPGNSGAEGTGVSLGTTTAEHKALVLGVQGHPDDVTWGSIAYHFDVGIDSASTEWFEADRFFAFGGGTEQVSQGSTWWPIYRPIPSGTELMVRGEASGTADALSAVIHGIS